MISLIIVHELAGKVEAVSIDAETSGNVSKSLLGLVEAKICEIMNK